MKKHSINDMQAMAKRNGGRWISGILVNRKSQMLWECAYGHKWEAAARQIMQNSWCPECARAKKRKLDHSKVYMNTILLEQLDGLLLGDGCLHRSNIHARLSIGFQHKEFADYISHLFVDYGLKTKPIPSVLKNGNTWIVHRGSSCVHPDFTEQYNRWYKPSKEIPSDVRLTPASILIWYLCDGSLRKRMHHKPTIAFSTESFSSQEIDSILLPALNKIYPDGFYRYKKYTDRTGRDRYIIRSRTKATETFLSYVGGKSPVACYDYKFQLGL